MKFHEIAEQVVAQHSCKMVFPAKTAGEYATKDSAYAADKVEGLEIAGDGHRPRKSKGFLLDAFSASAFVAVRGALTPVNRDHFDRLAASSPCAAVKLAFKCCKVKS